MKKALNFTQHLVVSTFQAVTATLIILAIMMAMTSCSTSTHYSKKKPYRVSNKPHGRCVGGTCYAF